ncbi:MAG: hypothetical protein KKH34_07280 [Candidatus Omnitrophica bacterium]|nr:hypothetical protein [Candidatus Omnitrophota bacterium]
MKFHLTGDQIIDEQRLELRRRRLPQEKSSNAALAVRKDFKEAVGGRI